MPKIDTSAIEGFESMSTEDRLAALLDMEVPEAVDLSRYVEKTVFDAKAREAAGLSRQLKGKPSDDELATLRNELAATKTTVETLQREKTVADWTARYLSLGYDKELASATATAMAAGDMETVFKNGETHRTALEQSIRAELMRSDPKPGGAGGRKEEVSDIEEQAKRIGKAKADADRAASEGVRSFYLK